MRTSASEGPAPTSSRQAAEDGPPTVFRVSPIRAVRPLVALVAAFVAAGIVAVFVLPYLDHAVLHRYRLAWLAWFASVQFNLDNELSVPNWYQTVMLLADGFLLLVIAAARRKGDPFRRYWKMLGAVFLFMSLDEEAAIHDQTMDTLRGQVHASGVFHFAWVIPALIFVAAAAVFFVPFLKSLPDKTRQTFLLAGALYVGGALGMEMVGGYLHSHHYPAALYSWETIAEETLEMSGQLLFFYALLCYLRDHVGPITFEMGTRRGAGVGDSDS